MNLYEAALTLGLGGIYVFRHCSEFWAVERAGESRYKAHPFNPKRANDIQVIGSLSFINNCLLNL